MADAQKNQWIPVYSQSSYDIMPQIPNTPPTLHIRHSASAGNLRAQTSPFFDTPADLRSTQYVAYQPHLYSAPSMQGHWGMTSSPLSETHSHEPVNTAEPAKRSYRGRWSIERKLAHVLDAINATNWSLADFLYFAFRVKDEKTDDGVVHRTKQHAGTVGRFMRGQDKYVVSDILHCWFRSPDGRPRTPSEHEQMYSTSTPYSGIRAARPAITSFAAQIVKIKLLKERQEAVKPSGGLHANTNPKATNKAITWEDMGLTTVADVTKTIKDIQPLTYNYLLELSTPKVHRRNGVLVQRTRRPPELVINCSDSNCIR
jgi:hypothetical protein